MYKLLGNGTHGRVWHTDEAKNIAFSLFVKTDCNIKEIEGLTIQIANLLVEVFRKLYSIQLEIKSPNDIVLGNKKIGGILTETKLVKESVKCIVIGIGINTNQGKFAEKISRIATSIKNEFHIEVDNERVIAKFCELFEEKLVERNVLK